MSSIFGEHGEKTGLLSRSIEYLFDMVDRYEAKAKVRFACAFEAELIAQMVVLCISRKSHSL